MSIVYREGGLVQAGGDGLRSGACCPNIAVTTGDGQSTLYAALRQGSHVLVVPPRMHAMVVRAVNSSGYEDLVEVVSGDADGRGAATLVRPDGHIGAVAGGDDLSGISDTSRSMCRKQPPARKPKELNGRNG